MTFFYKFLIYAFIAVCVVVSPIAFSTIFCFVSSLIHGKKIPKKQAPSTWSEHCLLYKLLIAFPRQLVSDFFESDPDAFPLDKTGLVIFEGQQGSGKSVSAVFYMDMLRRKYPKLSIMSNIKLSFADSRLDDWSDIVFKNNGVYGQVVFLDEIQNYFNSLESKNFPPEMLTEICQQRKQRKTIIGTVQVFGRVAKPIREQTSILVRPRTILGCLTIMSLFKPSFDDNAQVTRLMRLKTHIFVHTPEIRNAYDTFETVSNHALHGFKPRSEMLIDSPVSSEIKKDKKPFFFQKTKENKT